MSRAWIVAALCAVAGCFSDVKTAPCPEGSENCPCSGLECEEGLVCQDALCVLPGGPPGTGSTSLAPSTSTSTSTSGTTSTTSTESSVGESLDSGSSTSGSGGSSTTGPLCGNGVIDDSEMCDGGSGCTDCMFDNYGCNPLTNVPCDPGLKCSVFENIEGAATSECRVFSNNPPGGLHESNCFSFGLQDQWCDLGLACVTSQSTTACDVNCCVEYCDLQDPNFECGHPGDTCEPALADLAPPGLQWLGVCITD